MENETKKPLGILFDRIEYYDLTKLDSFISNLNFEQSIFCIKHALEIAHKSNLFSLEESEVISKSIRLLLTNTNKTDNETN